MIKTNYKQLFYSASLVILVFFGLYMIRPVYHFVPHGIVLFSKPPLQQSSLNHTDVSVSENAKEFAIIRVEYFSKTESEEAAAKLLNYVKARAKALGAEKMVVNYFGYNSGMSTLIMEASVLRD